MAFLRDLHRLSGAHHDDPGRTHLGRNVDGFDVLPYRQQCAALLAAEHALQHMLSNSLPMQYKTLPC